MEMLVYHAKITYNSVKLIITVLFCLNLKQCLYVYIKFPRPNEGPLDVYIFSTYIVFNTRLWNNIVLHCQEKQIEIKRLQCKK